MVVGHQNFINTKVGYGTKSVEKHRLHGIKAVKKYSKRKRKVNFLSLHDKLTIYSLSLFNKCLFLDFMQMNINSKLNVYCYFSTLHEKQHSSYNFFLSSTAISLKFGLNRNVTIFHLVVCLLHSPLSLSILSGFLVHSHPLSWLCIHININKHRKTGSIHVDHSFIMTTFTHNHSHPVSCGCYHQYLFPSSYICFSAHSTCLKIFKLLLFWRGGSKIRDATITE